MAHMAIGCLGLGQAPWSTREPLQGVTYLHAAGSPVHITLLEPEQLTLPHADHDRHSVQRFQSIALRGHKEVVGLLRREWMKSVADEFRSYWRPRGGRAGGARGVG